MRVKFYALFMLICTAISVLTATTQAAAQRATEVTAVESPIVNSGINVNDYLYNVPTHADRSAASYSTVGAFRFICTFGTAIVNGKVVQTATIDPVVYPGQIGKSHEHQFYGNTGINANSTYQTLRTTGLSSCMNILNRSGYWVPTMRDALGRVIRPEFLSIYYKAPPVGSVECTVNGRNYCIKLPRGLRYIFGYNMTSGGPPTGAVHFNVQGDGTTPGTYSTIVEAASHLAASGGKLGAIADAPQCWDGKNLDSADHRSHMAYPTGNGVDAPLCPETHPWILPAFTFGEWFAQDDTLDRSGTYTPGKATWRFSSDRMWMEGMGYMDYVPGTTFHADWFGAWEDSVMTTWWDNCINRLLSCNDGDLGNGKAMINMSGPQGNPTPRLVPAAPMAKEPFKAVVGPPK